MAWCKTDVSDFVSEKNEGKISIFCPRFSQKQSANQPKKLQGNGLLLTIKAHAKIQALLKEKKILPEKVTYVPLAQSHSIILQEMKGMFFALPCRPSIYLNTTSIGTQERSKSIFS